MMKRQVSGVADGSLVWSVIEWMIVTSADVREALSVTVYWV